MNLSRRLLTRLAATVLAGAALTTALPAFAADPKVKFVTTDGNFVVELYPDKAPKTVENFLRYVKDKHYDGTIFHRVIDGFMIQGGGMTANLQEKATRAPIPLEANNGLKNVRYSIAMARRPDPNSATAQFFINVKDNTMLDAPKPDGHGYAVFGQVIAGQEVVDKIRQVPTGRQGMYSDVPLRPVTIIAATQL